MFVKIYIAPIARLSTLQSIFGDNPIIFNRKLCVKEKGTTIYRIGYLENAFYAPRTHADGSNVLFETKGFFRAGLKKGGPMFTI